MLREAYERLLQTYGPQHWWPGQTPLEVIVGAILTQNTSWRNVERAVQQLKDTDLLDLTALHEVPLSELEETIRPAGYYRLKAKRLKNIIRFIVQNFGDVESMFEESLEPLRNQLLAINGIGPETADAILLYAGNFPTFVIDTYAARIAKRHGWIDAEAGYYELKQLFEDGLPQDEVVFNEYHALIVAVGKAHCKSQPVCDGCPLNVMLPQSGPLAQ